MRKICTFFCFLHFRLTPRPPTNAHVTLRVPSLGMTSQIQDKPQLNNDRGDAITLKAALLPGILLLFKVVQRRIHASDKKKHSSFSGQHKQKCLIFCDEPYWPRRKKRSKLERKNPIVATVVSTLHHQATKHPVCVKMGPGSISSHCTSSVNGASAKTQSR